MSPRIRITKLLAALLLLQAATGQTVQTRRLPGDEEETPLPPRPGRPHVRLRARLDGPVFTLAFSPDGRRLFFRDGHKRYTLRDMETGRESVLALVAKDQDEFRAAEFSPDGRHLALVREPFTWRLSTTHEVQVYDLGGEAAALRSTLKVKSFGDIRRLVWGEDGATLAAAGKTDPKLFRGGPLTAYTWRVEEGAAYAAFPLEDPRTSFMTTLEETADTAELLAVGRVLLTYNDRSAKFWDARTGERLLRREADVVGVSPDRRLVVTATAGAPRAQVWEAFAP
jgi:hypothetical protein